MTDERVTRKEAESWAGLPLILQSDSAEFARRERQRLARSYLAVLDENAKLREALEAIASGKSCTVDGTTYVTPSKSFARYYLDTMLRRPRS